MAFLLVFLTMEDRSIYFQGSRDLNVKDFEEWIELLSNPGNNSSIYIFVIECRTRLKFFDIQLLMHPR